MEIRTAVENDLSRIMEIYAYARTYMKEHGNPNQWGPTNWPPEELIRADIQKGKSYVCLEKEDIVGVFFYDFGERVEKDYYEIEGQWIGSDTYGVVHRIASSGSHKGVGAYCLNWAFEKCGDLRIDTHHDNKTMQNLLGKLGFQRCGIIHVEEDDEPRIAYEKIGKTI